MLLVTVATPSARGSDILEYLPEDALGFVLVRDMAGTNEKCEAFMQMFDLPLSAPLAFVRISTELSEGITQNGGVLIALLPGSRKTDPPEPMVLLPAEDYSKFASSLQGDESGDVCRVNIAGEDVLVAKQGPYALLMNVENRDTLEILIGLEAAPVKLLESWADWLQDNDVTIALMPEGLAKLLEIGHENLAARRRLWASEIDIPEFEGTLSQMQQGLTFYHKLLALLGAKLEGAACGVSLDKSHNLRFGVRLLHDSKQPDTDALSPRKPLAALAGYDDQPFVFAGGGALQGDCTRALAQAIPKLSRQMSHRYGLDKIDDDQWQELETAYLELADPMRFASILMLPGEDGDPFFNNIYGITEVDNALESLQSYRRIVEAENRMMALSTSDIRLQYEIKELRIAGLEALEQSVDVAAAAHDPHVPQFNWMLESMFGEDGKFRMILVAVDENQLVFGLADEQEMEKAVQHLQQGELGLQNNSLVQATTSLLPGGSTWKFYVSPQGCVQWFKRVLDEMLGQIMPQSVEFPQYDESPPVGLSVHLHAAQVEVDIVWPRDALRALADFIKKTEEL